MDTVTVVQLCSTHMINGLKEWSFNILKMHTIALKDKSWYEYNTK